MAATRQDPLSTCFINPRVLTSFLNDYLVFRYEKWNSNTGWLESWIWDTSKERYAECQNLNRLFYNVNGDAPVEEFKTVDGTIKFLCELGERAEKPKKPGKLTDTMHAIRTYIIFELLRSPYKDEFIAKRDALFDKAQKLRISILDAMNKKTGKDSVDVSKTEYLNTLKALAFLGHPPGLSEAMLQGLFDTRECPSLRVISNTATIDLLNENWPKVLHPDFYLLHYEVSLRSMKHIQISFEDYVARAQEKGPNKIHEMDLSKSTGIFQNNSIFSGFSGSTSTLPPVDAGAHADINNAPLPPASASSTPSSPTVPR